jgi:DNA-binding transcriptional ArsR family regulator
MPSADLLLHPVRLRIVQCLLGDRPRTTSQLRDDLPDVAPATLYRHVATLHDAGLLEVVDERRVRGATERTYRLRDPVPAVGAEEAATMSVEEHRQAFTAFVAGLLGDFDRYLDSGQLLDDLVGVVRPLLDNKPSARRTRRIFTTVLMPGR